MRFFPSSIIFRSNMRPFWSVVFFKVFWNLKFNYIHPVFRATNAMQSIMSCCIQITILMQNAKKHNFWIWIEHSLKIARNMTKDMTTSDNPSEDNFGSTSMGYLTPLSNSLLQITIWFNSCSMAFLKILSTFRRYSML